MFTEEEKLKYVCRIVQSYISKSHRLYEDVIQEGLLGFVVAEQRWSDTPGGMPDLACGRMWVTGNIKHFFRQQAKHRCIVELKPNDIVDESDLEDRLEILAQLEVALICLAPQDREIITLTYLSENGLTQAENAKKVGMPYRTFQLHLQKAKLRLKGLMDDCTETSLSA